VGGDGGVAGGGHDAFVGGEEVVGVGVEVGDAADEGGAGDEVVAVAGEFGHQVDVAGVAEDEAVAFVAVVAAGDRAVLGVVVQADDFVAPFQEFLDDVAADEAGGSGN